MPETYSVFNAAEYIETEEDAQEILRLSAEQDPGDGSVIRAALNTVARAQSMSASAYDAGLDIGNLYETLSEDGNPTLATLLKVTHALAGCGKTLLSTQGRKLSDDKRRPIACSERIMRIGLSHAECRRDS